VQVISARGRIPLVRRYTSAVLLVVVSPKRLAAASPDLRCRSGWFLA